MAVRYLTVQDVLWINHRVTRKVLRFDFVTLEEATHYQYGYGNSRELPTQAAWFLEGFLRKAPFEYGNEGTILVALATFLRLNGRWLKLTDEEALDWIYGVAEGRTSGAVALADRIGDEPQDGLDHVDERSVAEVAMRSFARFPQTLAVLGQPPFRPEPVAHGLAGQEIWTGPGDVRDYLG